MTPQTTEHNPYVGPEAFSRKDDERFFGRDSETYAVLSLLIAYRVLLLYAQSGAGKTSLLHAGLIPRLKDEGFSWYRVARVGDPLPKDIKPEEIANRYVFNTLLSLEGEQADPKQLTQMTLVDYMGMQPRPSDQDGLEAPRVLIFDQFEEIVTTHQECWEDRKGFFEQVAEVLKEEEWGPLLRVVFVMREDHVTQLDPYVSLLPGKLRIRYRLEHLRAKPALEAITRPLEKTRRSFEKGVAERLVDNLLRSLVEMEGGRRKVYSGKFVEPVQLQVVCQSLWDNLPADVTEITKDHLKEHGDVDLALLRFYEQAINETVQLFEVTEHALRVLFEEHLITPAGTRGIVYRGLLWTGGMPNRAIDKLENKHLIRAERRAGGRWYELTHDRFIEPIQRSNRAWRKKERVGLLGVLSMSTYFLLLVPLSLGYLLLQLWPAQDAVGATPVTMLFWTSTLSAEARILLTMALIGALGSLVQVYLDLLVRSLPRVVRRRYYGLIRRATSEPEQEQAHRLVWTEVVRYVLLPFTGAAMALIAYLVIRGGFIPTEISDINLWGFAALAALVGLFSEQFAEKLKEIFEVALETKAEKEQ